MSQTSLFLYVSGLGSKLGTILYVMVILCFLMTTNGSAKFPVAEMVNVHSHLHNKTYLGGKKMSVLPLLLCIVENGLFSPSQKQYQFEKGLLYQTEALRKQLLFDFLNLKQAFFVAPVYKSVTNVLNKINIGKHIEQNEKMRFETLRFASFGNFPSDKPFSIRFAQAGFYSTGLGDEVACYCCGVRVSNWSETDSPIDIHAYLSPSCQFIVNNEAVNALVTTAPKMLMRQNGSLNEKTCLNNVTFQKPKHTYGASAAADDDEKCKDDCLKGNDVPSGGSCVKSTGTNLADSRRHIQTTFSTQNTESPSSKARQTDYQSAEAAQGFDKTNITRTLLDMGFEVGCVETAMRYMSGDVPLSIESVLEKLLDLGSSKPSSQKHTTASAETATPETVSDLVATAQQSNGSESRINASSPISLFENDQKQTAKSKIDADKQKLKKEMGELKAMVYCSTCKRNESNVAFLPCGHLLTCEGCDKLFKICPVCNDKILGTVRVYRA